MIDDSEGKILDIQTHIDLSYLLIQLTHQLNQDELFQLVVDLDHFIEDYGFTDRLKNHFQAEILKEDQNELIYTLKEDNDEP